jgi:tetratricopeptide (TPR) repeat protein
LLIAAIGCTGWAHAHLPGAGRSEFELGFVPSPKVMSTASLGFDALIADYYWIQAVQVVGAIDAVDEEAATHLGELIDLVTTLNPHVGHPYRFAAVWMTHNEDQVRAANALLERAIESHPEDWRHYFYLGFNNFYYLQEYEVAATALEVAIQLPGAPNYLARLVARLKSQEGDIDVAELFLRQLLQTETDETVIAKLESALDEIEIEYKARHLDRARAAYESLAGRDISSPGDLIRGPHRVLEKLPNPEPDAMPSSLSQGSIWEIDPQTGRIVSSYLGRRYEVHYADFDRKRLKAWRDAKDGRANRTHDEVNQGDG